MQDNSIWRNKDKNESLAVPESASEFRQTPALLGGQSLWQDVNETTSRLGMALVPVILAYFCVQADGKVVFYF